jgi:hypothetical protein
VVLDGPAAQSWIAIGPDVRGDPPGLETDPFTTENMSVGKFFNGAIASVLGRRLSRLKVVYYLAYKEGILHDGPDTRYRGVPDFELLDRLRRNRTFKRNDVYYMVLGMAQCMARSPDAAKFVAAARG